MSAVTIQAGHVVRLVDKQDSVGIVTQDARLSGIFKGKLSVMFVGHPYTVTVDPAELERVTIVEVAAVPDAEQAIQKRFER